MEDETQQHCEISLFIRELCNSERWHWSTLSSLHYGKSGGL